MTGERSTLVTTASLVVAAGATAAWAWWNSSSQAAEEARLEKERQDEELARLRERDAALEAIERKEAAEKEAKRIEIEQQKARDAALIERTYNFLVKKLDEVNDFIARRLLPAMKLMTEIEKQASTGNHLQQEDPATEKLSEIFIELKEGIDSYKKDLQSDAEKLESLKDMLYAQIRQQLISFQRLLITALKMSLPENIMNIFIALMSQDKNSDTVMKQVRESFNSRKGVKKLRAKKNVEQGTSVFQALKINISNKADKEKHINSINLHGRLIFIDDNHKILQKVRAIFTGILMKEQPLIPILCVEGMRMEASVILGREIESHEYYFSESDASSVNSSSTTSLAPVVEEEIRLVAEDEIAGLESLLEDEAEKNINPLSFHSTS